MKIFDKIKNLFCRKNQEEELEIEIEDINENVALMIIISLSTAGEINLDIAANNINETTSGAMANLLYSADVKILLSQLFLLLHDLKNLEPELEQFVIDSISKYASVKDMVEKHKDSDPFISPLKALNNEQAS